MTINNSLNGMLQAQIQLNQSASNIAQVASAVGSPELGEVASTITDELVAQIPIVATYSANAKSIELQEIMLQTLLDIKA